MIETNKIFYKIILLVLILFSSHAESKILSVGKMTLK